MRIKKWLCFVVMFIGFFIFNSCDNVSKDDYYVKYIMNSQSIYITSRYIQIKSENNSNLDFSVNSSSWETIIGPVKYGFNANIKASFNSDFTNSSIGGSNIGADIYVSKNNGPFALKKSTGISGTNVVASYKINF